MKRPTHIQVGPIRWTIDYDTARLEEHGRASDDDLFGLTRGDQKTIHVNRPAWARHPRQAPPRNPARAG